MFSRRRSHRQEIPVEPTVENGAQGIDDLALLAAAFAARRPIREKTMRTGTGYAATVKEYFQDRPAAVGEYRLQDRVFGLKLPHGAETRLPFKLTTQDGQPVRALCTLHIGNDKDVSNYYHPAFDGKVEQAGTSYVIFSGADGGLHAQKLTAEEVQAGTGITSNESQPIPNLDDSPEEVTVLSSAAMDLDISYIPSQQRLWAEMNRSPAAAADSIPYVLTVTG